jgi:hypothetical protein
MDTDLKAFEEYSFCEGTTCFDDVAECSTKATQHPCWTCKAWAWQDGEASLQLSKSAVPGRFRQAAGKKALAPGEIPPPPQIATEHTIAFDHAIPTDERGLPFLPANGGDPLTAKEIRNKGGLEKLRKSLYSQGNKS